MNILHIKQIMRTRPLILLFFLIVSTSCYGEEKIEEIRQSYSRDDFEQVINLSDKSIEDGNVSGKMYYYRGWAFFRTGKGKDAEESFLKAIALAPEMAGLYSSLGFIYDNAKDFNDTSLAIEFYSKAIDLDGNSYQTFINRGGVYKDTGRYGEAISDFQMAAKLALNQNRPVSVLERLYLQILFMEFKLERKDNIIETYEKIKEIDPDYQNITAESYY